MRTQALGAISSLIRHSQPGIAAFCLGNGYAALKDALGSDDAKLQRKALNLIQYLLHNAMVDRSAAAELGLPNQMMHLASSDDSGVREAALGGLLELARDKTSGAGNLPDQDKLKDVLRSRIEGISTMDDLHAAREERQLVDSSGRNATTSRLLLREKGLMVLPGEGTPQQPPPDVAGKMFEPQQDHPLKKNLIPAAAGGMIRHCFKVLDHLPIPIPVPRLAGSRGLCKSLEQT